KKRDMDIHVGRHRFTRGECKRRIAGLGLHPMGLNNPASVFNTNECATGLASRNCHSYLFSKIVDRLIGGNRQHGYSTSGVSTIVPAIPTGFIEVNHLPGTMSTGGIAHLDEVPSPIGGGHFEFPSTPAIRSRRSRCFLYKSCIISVDVISNTASGVIPPPPLVKLIESDGKLFAGHRVSVAVDGDKVRTVGGVGI